MKNLFLFLKILIIFNTAALPQTLIKEPYQNLLRFQHQSQKNFKNFDSINYGFNLKHPDQKTKGVDEILFIDSILTYGVTGLGGRSKITFSYDELKKISSFTIFSFDYSSWTNSLKMTISYNLSGDIESVLHESWNGQNWENYIYETFTYSIEINQHIIKYWSNSEWKNQIMVTDTFNSAGHLIFSLNQQWVNNNWINSSRLTYLYFQEGFLSDQLMEVWNDEKWEQYAFLAFEYDEVWKLIAVFSHLWDENKWKNYALITYTYSSNEPNIIGLMEIWDDNNVWLSSERFCYSYNSEGYFKHGEYEYWDNNMWIPGDGPISIENPDGFELHYLTNKMFVYYNTGTDVDEKEEIYITNYKLDQNYPNPFNPTTSINYILPCVSRVKITINNLTGEMVKELTNSVVNAGIHKVDFNLDGMNLSSGIYFYTLEANAVDGSGSFRQTRKMVLLK